jgi:transcription elongation GreA/GreB family factor
MAKAFFKEDTVPDEGPVLPERPAEPQPITPGGQARLIAERAAIDPADEAQKTRAQILDRILATTRVVEPALLEGGVGFGCEVVVEDARRARRTYTIVGPDEVDAARGRISAESPLGTALLRARAGDSVEWRGAELGIVSVRLSDGSGVHATASDERRARGAT